MVAAAALGAACGGSRHAKEKAPAPPVTIWDLAPPGAYLAIATRHRDWWELLARAEAALAGAPGADGPRYLVGKLLSYDRVQMRSAAARRKSGIDDDGPMITYFTPRGGLHAYRIADPDAYRRTFRTVPDRQSRGRMTVDVDGDTCAPLEGFQVCAPREILTDVLDGKRSSIAWPAGPTPTVRVWAAPSVLGGLAGATEGGDGLRVEVDVGRGELAARAHLSGKPGGLLSAFAARGGSPLARRLPAADLSGAAVVNLSGWLELNREQMISNAGDARLTSRVSRADLLAALRGDALVWVLRGDRGGGLAVGVDRVDVARRLVASCEELAELVPGARISREGDRCRIRHDALAGFGNGELAVRVVDDALVAEVTAAAPAAAPTARRTRTRGAAFLDRVRTGDDGLAMWGAGLFAPMVDGNRASRTIPVDPFVLWLFLQVTESGGALRVDPDGIRAELSIATTWQYEDRAQAALAPLLARVARSEEVGAAAFRALAAAHPDSRLAADLAEGGGGAAVPISSAAVIGAAGLELGRQIAAMASAGQEVLSAYEEVVEAACRCKDAPCAERAVERYESWERRHGETVVDALTLARVKELSRQYETCLTPFFPDGEEAGEGGE